MDEDGSPANSASLKACEALLQEYLPKLKALPAIEVRRVVCGGCGDFKVVLTQPCAEHDAWKAESYTIEGEFLEKLKAIEGTSRHEAQEYTFETL
eukprot:CAMPEP_0119066302 /NCGR_PEP_ID=MMETSP1178-20130426/8888_1 /TAXON_ID=33656 /ORGANISM="unid sp, Strain CCMP2000" /LENGTH=94 /DNA_ID=CAMNT_0007047895 /DNA_START=45 /DNA_END=329 /DNA_ORIENTATION=-